MRTLHVVLPRSPHTLGHLNALAAAGWEVHAVASYPAEFLPRLDPSIVVHHATPPLAAGPRHGTRLERGAARVLLAATRTVAAADARLLAAGVDTRLADLLPLPGPRPASPEGRGDGEIAFPGLPSGLVETVASRTHAVHMARWLAGLIDRLRPEIVHSGPLMQCAPHALLARELTARPFPVWIVSNWGIDLHFGARDPAERAVGEGILAEADAFFAECRRDLELARQHGFAGLALGAAPIGAGLDVDAIQRLAQPGPTSARRAIIVKGYQNIIGRALLAIEALRRCAPLLHGYEVIVYSAEEDVRLAARLLEADTGIPVVAHPPGARSHGDVLRDMGRARVSLAASITDGLSTWTLEAMAAGAFPIQSSTACLGEWVIHGETALLPEPEDPGAMAAALARALQDDAFVDRAAARNRVLARERLDRAVVTPRVIEMYERAARLRPRHGARKTDTMPGIAGATPVRRTAAADGGGIVVNSIPKSGTHLLVAAVRAAVAPDRDWLELYEGWAADVPHHRAAITAAPAPVLVRGHLYHSEAWAELRRELRLGMVFLVRDPRDVVVSYVHWLCGPDRDVGAIQPYVRDVLPDHRTRLSAMISGFEHEGYRQPDIGTFVGRFAPWIDEPGVEVVRFEDLVSPARARATLGRVCRYACGDAACDGSLVDRMAAATDPALSPTYRQGRVGSWRTEFDEDLEALFERVAGAQAARLGYPSVRPRG